MSDKVILIIMDGWGIGDDNKVSAIHAAKTPFYDSIIKKYPNSKLSASGKDVGLPSGQMGNSEVGHMNLGAGRIVYQNLAKINIAVREGKLAKEKELTKAVEPSHSSTYS